MATDTLAHSIGSKACSLLSLPGYAGKVLATVSGAIYLLGEDEQIVWITQGDLFLHRRAVLTPSLPQAERGMRFTVQGARLLFDNVSFVDLSRAVVWQPSPARGKRQTSHRASALRLQTLRWVLSSSGCRGLAGVLRESLQPGQNDEPAVQSCEASLLRQAGRPVYAVIEGCKARDPDRILQAGLDLVGLGPGLTPSGDDFIGAVLFTARHLSRRFPDDQPHTADSIELFLRKARSLTNRISFAIMSDLAGGHGPEPLHALVNGLIEGGSWEQIGNAIGRLLCIGHTSGWDMLAGVLAGMLPKEGSALS